MSSIFIRHSKLIFAKSIFRLEEQWYIFQAISRHSVTQSLLTPRRTVSSQGSNLPTLLSIAPSKLVKILKSLSNSGEHSTTDFLNDLKCFVCKRIDEFNIQDLLFTFRWALSENITDDHRISLINATAFRLSIESLKNLPSTDLVYIIQFIKDAQLKLTSNQLISLVDKVDSEIQNRVISSNVTPSLVHAIVMAVGEIKELQWNCVKQCFSLVQQQPLAFTPLQHRDFLLLLTKSHSSLLLNDSEGRNCFKSIVEGLGRSHSTNHTEQEVEENLNKKSVFEEFHLSDQIELLIALEGRANAKVLCEKCLERLQREVINSKHIDKIVLLELIRLAKVWRPAVSFIQGPLPALLRAKMHEYSTLQILQILMNICSIGFRPPSLIMKIEMVLKQRAKSTSDLLMLSNDKFIQMLKNVILCGMKNKALFKYFTEALLVPVLTDSIVEELSGDHIETSISSCSSHNSRLSTMKVNDLLLIFQLWSSAKLIDENLFSNIADLLSEDSLIPRTDRVIQAIIGCATLCYRNTILFKYFEDQLQAIDFDNNRHRILEIIRLKEAMDVLGLRGVNLEMRLKKAILEAVKERPKEQFTWLGTNQFHPRLHVHGTVRARKFTW